MALAKSLSYVLTHNKIKIPLCYGFFNEWVPHLQNNLLSTCCESQNGSGRQVLVISHRELVPGEPPKTARVLRLLSKRRRTAGSHKRGNQVYPPAESIEATPYSEG